jgi:type IX secretion system PorP/SprF family membrane protein
MKQNYKYHFWSLVSFLLLFHCAVVSQQLPIFSQYLLNDYAYNPAIAGSKDFYDVKSNHRYQWVGITDAPRTYTLSINGPTKNKKMGFGGILYTDHVGPTRRTGFQASYAYHLNLNSDVKLGLALSAGLLEWKLDGHKIELYDLNDQVLVNNVMRSVVPDAKFGFMVYHKDWFVGGSIPNLLSSQLQFSNADYTGLSKLKPHYYFNGGYIFHVNEDLDIEPSFMTKLVAPAPLQLDIMTKITWKKQLWFGLAYRTMDAASAMVGYLFKQNILLGYSYDFTTSNLRNYSSGTHELMFGIRFVRSKTFESPSLE